MGPALHLRLGTGGRRRALLPGYLRGLGLRAAAHWPRPRPRVLGRAGSRPESRVRPWLRRRAPAKGLGYGNEPLTALPSPRGYSGARLALAPLPQALRARRFKPGRQVRPRGVTVSARLRWGVGAAARSAPRGGSCCVPTEGCRCALAAVRERCLPSIPLLLSGRFWCRVFWSVTNAAVFIAQVRGQ